MPPGCMPTRITTFSLTKEWTAKETTQALATAISSESASADTSISPPHAIMAHIFQFGVENFIELNERRERFCNEDLSMTNIAKVILNQPGSKVFQIIDAKADDYYPIDTVLPMMRSYGDGETYSAEADTLEELAAKLGFDNDAASTFVDSIERYNELCEKGHDDDFGKAAEKMHPIIEPPFKAVTYDTLKHTSVEDVSCMRRRCRQSLYLRGPITLRVHE